MNKYRFQFLVVLMSLALLGITLIQLYWISTTYENKDDQFQHMVNLTIGKVVDRVKEKERYEFGNARGIRNLFETMVVNQANRIVTLENCSMEQLTLIKAADIGWLEDKEKDGTEE